ncbi:MAG: hypothetical protein ACQESR_08570 [Planctomycetota bacterium]
MESCPTQAVLPLVGLAAENVIRDRYRIESPPSDPFLSAGPFSPRFCLLAGLPRRALALSVLFVLRSTRAGCEGQPNRVS